MIWHCAGLLDKLGVKIDWITENNIHSTFNSLNASFRWMLKSAFIFVRKDTNIKQLYNRDKFEFF